VTKRYNKRYSDVDVVRNPMMRVRDVITPHVVSVTPDVSVFVAAGLMLQKKISGLPVVDGLGNLVGVVKKATFCAVLKPTQNANGRNGSNSLSGPAAALRTSTSSLAAARCGTS
jgi:CBS-domain-containing membrane protein